MLLLIAIDLSRDSFKPAAIPMSKDGKLPDKGNSSGVVTPDNTIKEKSYLDSSLL